MTKSFGKKFKRIMNKGVIRIEGKKPSDPFKIAYPKNDAISDEELKFLKNLMDGMSKKKKFMTGR